jgi:predicted HicB family RNase H-like nuclease
MNNTMMYKGYTTSMVFDTEDKIIIGRVLDVDDIITFHGKSVSEFEKIFHVVVDDYLSSCKKIGSVPERPASGRLMLRVAPTVHAAALKAATRSGVSLNKWAEQAISLASCRSASQMKSRGKTRTQQGVAPDRFVSASLRQNGR